MNESQAARTLLVRVTDARGVAATAEPIPPGPGGGGAQALIHLDDGRTVVVPGHLLVAQPDGSYYLPYAFERGDVPGAAAGAAGFVPSGVPANDTTVVPVLEERLDVQTRARETGRVRIHKHVLEEPVVIDEPLTREDVVVERVPVNQYVSGPVTPRYEGETLVLPVLEEVVVTERRLVLREEVRVTRRQSAFRQPQTVVVRREQVELERVEGEQAADDGVTEDEAARRGDPTLRGPG